MNPIATVGLAMSDLLERAGCRLRGRNRADCVRCSGRAMGTIAFTSEVAFCHRCKWTANTITLAKQLGLLAADPESKRQRQDEARRFAEYRRTIERFEVWRDQTIRRYSSELRQLWRTAGRAEEMLAVYPDCEAAWNGLARYCHQEGSLNQVLDFLCCTKNSRWLDTDSTILDVFDVWRKIHGQG